MQEKPIQRPPEAQQPPMPPRPMPAAATVARPPQLPPQTPPSKEPWTVGRVIHMALGVTILAIVMLVLFGCAGALIGSCTNRP